MAAAEDKGNSKALR